MQKLEEEETAEGGDGGGGYGGGRRWRREETMEGVAVAPPLPGRWKGAGCYPDLL